MRTFKLLGFLLSYPSETHIQKIDECWQAFKEENCLNDKALAQVQAFMQNLGKQDLLDWQEHYVGLFDRTPSLSLHLFEHVHGDSRVRGQALADLSDVYEKAGLIINTEETPDYLPLFLEYLSILPRETVEDNLASVVDILSALAKRLQNRESDYAHLITALLEMTPQKPDSKIVNEALKGASGKAYDLEQLDKEWEEQFAFENTKQTTEKSTMACGQQNSCCHK